jgi:hypothetical protein
MRVADADHVARLQFLLADLLAVDEGAAGVVAVHDAHARVGDLHLTVDARHVQVVEKNVAILATVAEGRDLAVGEREVSSFVGTVDD